MSHIVSVFFVFLYSLVDRPKKVIKLVPEYLLKKRKAYQAIKANQAKLALLEKRKVRNDVTILVFTVRCHKLALPSNRLLC